MTAAQLVAVVLAGLLTYVIRSSFLVFAGRMTALPPTVTAVLRMIPPAALAALVLPGLLRPGGMGYDPLNPIMVGGIVAVVVSIWKHNIGLSLAAGLVVIVAVQPVLG